MATTLRGVGRADIGVSTQCPGPSLAAYTQNPARSEDRRGDYSRICENLAAAAARPALPETRSFA